MSTVVKDLGPVTAYADAVAAGYTGTKEEWQALMASYASVAEEAQEAKEGAEAAQEAAESARDAAIDAKEGAEDAVDGFGAVVTQATNQAVQTVRAEGTTQVGNVSSEGTTQVNAVQAKGAEVLQSIPADYTELSNDVVQLKEDLTAEETARANAVTAEATAREAADDAINAELATKADADTPIATADQLMSDVFTVDQVPYLFRPSGGSGADREYDEIVGGSIVWNQLCNGSSVTVLNGHKYYMLKGGTASIGASTGSAITGLTSGTDMVSDLTKMFGSTIADYIYSLEQTTAGAGVAWFKQFFAEDYYSYDAGTMKHVEGLSAHVMRDADENVIGNYPLDDSLTLRGIPKLDSNNQLWYDGDIYSADGTVTRNYGIVDLGTLTWGNAGSTGFAFASLSSVGSGDNNKLNNNFICDKYGVAYWNSSDDKTVRFSGLGNQVGIKDTAFANYTAADFKAAMSGIYLVYELATPTTEEAEPYNEIQIVDDFGTEEYVTTSLVPVGHNTKYPANLRSAIERVMEQVPEAPSANGTYTLKATRTSSGVTYAWTAE